MFFLNVRNQKKGENVYIQHNMRQSEMILFESQNRSITCMTMCARAYISPPSLQ